MKLSEILEENHIIPDLKAGDKKGVLEEMAETIVSHEPSVDKRSLVRVLLERERLGSTGIGEGVAIPHGKFDGISRPVISFGRSRKGLDFESMDGQPAFLFFLFQLNLRAKALMSNILLLIFAIAIFNIYFTFLY